MTDQITSPPYASRQSPESTVSSSKMNSHQSTTRTRRRPTTPEIAAPIALLSRNASLLHSPSLSLLRKIKDGKTSPPNAYLKSNPAISSPSAKSSPLLRGSPTTPATSAIATPLNSDLVFKCS